MSYMNKIMASCKPSALKKVNKTKKVDPRIQQSLDEGAENYNPRGYMGHTQKKTEEKPSPNKKKGPCWKGYEMIGMKNKGGKKVPNCVPLKK